MRKILFIVSMILLLYINIVSAHEHDFSEAKQLIDFGISCDELTDEQLEAIGEYYMEQMHSGEAHELMDTMMGGEGSESLKQIHINMAKRLYCNEDIYIGYGMMGSGGMMEMMNGNMMDSGMMGTYGFGYWNIVNVLYVLLLIGIIVLVYFWIFRLWKDMKKKDR